MNPDQEVIIGHMLQAFIIIDFILYPLICCAYIYAGLRLATNEYGWNPRNNP